MPTLTDIPLSQLQAHPLNSNVMSPAAMEKLAAHLADHDRYPPLIVRPLVCSLTQRGEVADRYEILDGHHRAKVLSRLGRATARCDIWRVDDVQALELLATLNCLQGRDDPRRRAALIAALATAQRRDAAALAQRLPEEARHIAHFLRLAQPPPTPVAQAPDAVETMPQPVVFFLLPEHRRQLQARLSQLDADRSVALMKLCAMV